MIGGRFKVASVASIAAAGLFMGGVSAQAADLGGNCCADLEERVAELEATTARKGNRKVSLEISGWVNEAVLYWDDGVDNDVYQVGNVQSRTRFRFKGNAKINADWSAGFLIEIGMTRAGSSFSYDRGGSGRVGDDSFITGKSEDEDGDGKRDNIGAGLDVRHQALYVKSKSLGTVWLGHTSDATDGIANICLGCTMGNYGATASADIVGGLKFRDAAGTEIVGVRSTLFNADGDRQSLVKYISPTFAGFSLSGHWADDTVDNGEGYGVALRYAGEFGAIRFAAGVGYQVAADDGADSTELSGSASIQHVPTGLYVSGSLGQEDDEGVAGDFEDTFWHVSAGINQKFSSLGKTNIGGYYGNFDRSIGTNTAAVGSTDVQSWGLTVHQHIDAAAMEVYVQYHNITGDSAVAGDFQDVNLIMGGARIKF